jgi:hypothetical protein
MKIRENPNINTHYSAFCYLSNELLEATLALLKVIRSVQSDNSYQLAAVNGQLGADRGV